MSAVDSLDAAINLEVPCAAKGLTRGRGPEADAAFPCEALDVDDALQGDRVAAVLGLQRQGRLARACADIGSGERLLERIGARGRHQRAHDLPAVESDLDTHPLRIHCAAPI